MRILVINKFFYLGGGSERYMFDCIGELEANGHDVIPFAMMDARNHETPYSKHFVSPIAYRGVNAGYKLRNAGRIAAKTVYSFETRRKLEKLIAETRPDVAHVHMVFHQLSPSVFHALHRFNVPTVQTLHNYKLVCPATELYVAHRREPCERCLRGGYWHCAANRCIKKALGASVLAAGAQYFHRTAAIYEKHVDVFCVATDYLRRKCIEGGLPQRKLHVLPLTVAIDETEPHCQAGGYVFAYGRLVPQKGFDTLIRAAARTPEIPVKIAGDGEDRTRLEGLAQELGAANVRFLGFVDGPHLAALLAEARTIVVPSEWPETFGLVIYESYAMGKPVIASRIGGLPEAMEEGQTGLLVAPADPMDLANAMRRMMRDDAAAEAMGRAGRAKAEMLAAGHYNRLMAAFERAITNRREA